jgi:Helicase associated domain
MSDLSLQNDASLSAAVAAATANLQSGNFYEDPDLAIETQHRLNSTTAGTAAASASGATASAAALAATAAAVPLRISLQRDRLNSIASVGEASVSNMLLDSGFSFDGNNDVSAYVAAAMASVGDELEELAGVMEAAAAAAAATNFSDNDTVSQCSSLLPFPPLIGALEDTRHTQRPRSWSTASGKLSVDMEAVHAAVEAAEAASGPLGLHGNTNNNACASTAGTSTSSGICSDESTCKPEAITSKRESRKSTAKRKMKSLAATGAILPKGKTSLVPKRSLPIRSRAESVSTTTSLSSLDSAQLARAAAGYPPASSKHNSNRRTSLSSKPLKKRIQRMAESETRKRKKRVSAADVATPKISNRALVLPTEAVSSSTLLIETRKSTKKNATASDSNNSNSNGGPANQKWEAMFSALLEFAQERRSEETKELSDQHTLDWTWDGHVPTNHKTSDGKALGRWVNNQRSAKTKGTLRLDREERLVGAGLKWSVVVANSWEEMLQELQIYVNLQTRAGRRWDGNVPTTYQIKSRTEGKFNGEDKNLGRWVNRQRSLEAAEGPERDSGWDGIKVEYACHDAVGRHVRLLGGLCGRAAAAKWQ